MMPDETRREILKKAMYLTPTILTLPTMPAFASSGSEEPASPQGRGATGPKTGDWWPQLFGPRGVQGPEIELP